MKLQQLTLICLFALGVAAVGPAHALYKCVDDKGVTHYGDTMPPQCAKKEIKEMTKQGSTVKTYEAPKTPEQLKAEAEERERNREVTKRMNEQKLRDGALLATYGAEREFDIARDKDVAVLEARRKSLAARAPDIEKYLKKMENEMEFYKEAPSKSKDGKDAKPAKDAKSAKPREAPAQVQADYTKAKNDKANLDAEFAKMEQDKKDIFARYEGEKQRWKKLKAGMPAGTLLDEKGDMIASPSMPSQIVGQSTIIPGRARGMAECAGKTYECTLGLDYICRSPDIGGPGVNAKLVPCKQVTR